MALIIQPLPDKLPRPEVHYQWKELVIDDETGKVRLLTPWSDPEQHECPMDQLFASRKAAHKGKIDWGGENEGWILVKVTYEPIQLCPGEDKIT